MKNADRVCGIETIFWEAKSEFQDSDQDRKLDPTDLVEGDCFRHASIRFTSTLLGEDQVRVTVITYSPSGELCTYFLKPRTTNVRVQSFDLSYEQEMTVAQRWTNQTK